MRGLVGFLLLGTGLGIAHFELRLTGTPEKLAALELTTLSPAVDELRTTRVEVPQSNKPTMELLSQATVIASAQIPLSSTQPLPKSARLGDYAARRELIRAIQRELARAGCYAGAKTGEWRRDTKRAMSAFLAGVNASLPVEEPDYILLSLVRSDTRAVCMKKLPTESVVRIPQNAVSSRSDLPGRMSIGGPASGSANLIVGPVAAAPNRSSARRRQARRELAGRGLTSYSGGRSLREILTHPLAMPQD